MTTAEENLPNLLRATATLIRIQHGPGCPEFGVWRRAAELLDRVAAAGKPGAGLRAGEREAALRVAEAFLAARGRAEEPSGVPA